MFGLDRVVLQYVATRPDAQVSGIDPATGTRELQPDSFVTIGRAAYLDIVVARPVIGGRSNSRIDVDADGTCHLTHLGHSLPILLNGLRVLEMRPTMLSDGDTIDIGTTDGDHLRFRLRRVPADVARTPRMRLRRLCAEDRAEFVRVYELSREVFAQWSPRADRDETFDKLFTVQLEKTVRGLQSGTALRLVGLLDDGRIAGFFNLNDISRGAFQNALASWRVNAELARQGYGTEGVTALLDLAFAPRPAGLELHRVQANINPANLPSVRLAEKLGFRREGLAKAYLKIAGTWCDHLLYAKLAEEHGGV